MASANTSVWEKTATTPVLALLPDNSIFPHMSLVPFKLLSLLWSSEGMSQIKSMWAAL